MGAVKTWVPNELLKSADLNGAFTTVAQGYMPGIVCFAGAAVTGIAPGVATELSPAAPVAGNDQGGYWSAANSRIVIPVGLGGLYAVSYLISTTGGTKGDFASAFMQGGNQGQATYFARTGSTMWQTIAYVGPLADGATLWAQGTLYTTGGDMTLSNLRVLRLATFGLYK